MGSIKPWQVVLFIAAVASLAFAAWNAMSGPKVELATRTYLVDIATGELYLLELEGRGISIPAKHPETGKYSMLSVIREEDGSFHLGRSLSALESCDVKPGVSIDLNSGAIEVVNPDSPKTFRRVK